MFEGGEATVLTHDKESFLAGFCIVCRLCESFIVFGFKLRWKALAVLVVSLPPPPPKGSVPWFGYLQAGRAFSTP